ncbi:amidohydrolase family protein [Agrobacterium vitis]|uniref:Amidohydrolase family protein n=1 Tax=Agrobacterium vitis TaxID=373 RepID=A0AAE4WEP4_AGRVI|nr:amidohydrolase family protein [Agrobacterium vitis]MCF1499925.1 amidohydrolase family protein [Allorhizobium sp. Av2]MCM2442862.1 amidohydrolase family protein [Agrobacterium vitis]MUZ58800.1 amidohydrolase family protein [Agrobacterium vitis]MVA66435.1 amidohydrolase family protein [Agrobacterium vitis]MVA88472.1 amidohydrolase family protein [Agrobacterium vitis]
MSDFDRVVRGTLVTEDGITENGFVAIRDGIIAALGSGSAPAAREVDDFGEALILPGIIDGQVHSRSQKDQEDFIWSTRSAAAGGVTTIVDMPYDAGGKLICTAELLTEKAESAAEQARVDFALYGTIRPSDGPKHIAEMADAGAAGFKFSTFETDPNRFPRIPTPLLYAAFAEVAKTGLIAGVHNENDECVKVWSEAVKATGRTDYLTHGESRPPIAETLAIAEVYEIAAATACPAHIVHCSVGRGYELAQAYRAQGVDATIEACIHYLVCSEEEDVSRLLGRAKCNPPIRSAKEREKLWQHLAAGHITIVSTDHVSWSLAAKSSQVMLENSSGMPGLEVLSSLLLDGLTDRGLPLTFAAKLLSGNPARLFRLTAQKGALAIGLDADIAVFAERPRIYDATASGHNVVGWSPYEGKRIRHTAIATFLRGQMIYDGKDVLAAPGTGRFIKPTRALSKVA